MKTQILGRRRLLWYLGLGTLGAGGAIFGGRLLNAQRLQPANQPTPAKPDLLATAPVLPVRQPLPAFEGISQWLNSAPLTLTDLKGKVVLVQFWTFACINCQRTLPDLVRWHQQYEAQGLQVIGVHTPEFAFERDIENVKSALQQEGITYPVPIDGDYKTWRAYNNNAWPHLYLADRNGILRYDHTGEGAYSETEQAIKILLG